jgi:hypothetical protein
MTPVQILQLAAEADSKIVESVFLADESPRRIVALTAPDRHNGCSWIVARTARHLAKRISGTVCLVDANLRHPALHNLFCIANSRGFLQALQKMHPSAITLSKFRIQISGLFPRVDCSRMAADHWSQTM